MAKINHILSKEDNMCFWDCILTEHPDGFGDGKWRFDYISCNICFECIKTYSDKPWCSKIISRRKDLPFGSIIKTDGYDKYTLDFGFELIIEDLIHNIGAPWYFIVENKLPWDTKALSRNRNISWDFVKSHPKGFDGCEWNMHYLSGNKSLTLDFFEENIKSLHGKNWIMKELSRNIGVVEAWCKKYPNGNPSYKWHFSNFTKTVPLSFVENNMKGIHQEPWNIDKLCENKNLTLDFIKSNMNGICDQRWNARLLSKSDIITWDFIMENPKGFYRRSWSPAYLCKNRNLSFEYADKYPCGLNGQPWNISIISTNPNISLEFVEKYPRGLNGQPWNMYNLSRNPNLSWSFVEKYPNGLFGRYDSWDIDCLSQQKWKPDTDKIRLKKVKPVMSTVSYDPDLVIY